MKKLYFILLVLGSINAMAQKNVLREMVYKKAGIIEPKIISWRRDLHEHPELGNQEVRTADLVAIKQSLDSMQSPLPRHL